MKLRGYIPLAAPLNWEPSTGNEPPLRTMMSFTTNWFSKRIGIDFSEAYHVDPVFRFDSILKMKNYIKDTFPRIPYFREHDADGYEQECATISGVFGVCLVAIVYGMEIVYSKNDWPSINPASHLSIEEIKNLKPLDLENNPVVEQLFRQMDIINENWGKIDGYMNYQGVLNNAFKIRGTEILMDMVDDPGMCRHLFAHITDTMKNLILMVQRRQRASGFFIDSMSTSNCVVNMISPESYNEFILPHDIELSETFKDFGIHSCNWVIDPYIDLFNKVRNLSYIDFGFSSDLVKVKKIFGDATREVFYNPAYLVSKTDEQVRNDVKKIFSELAPCELCLPDIDVYLPDEKLIDFVEMAQRISTQG